MARKVLVAAMAGAVFAAGAPALAQDGDAPMFEQNIEMAEGNGADELDPFAMLGGMFEPEPLTPEQESRLPQAAAVVGKLIPEGAMGEMMGSVLDGFFKPFAELPKASAASRAAQGIGVGEYDLELSEEQAKEIADMFDPAFEEREAREMAMLPEMVGRMMAAMEPPMRKAMTELYAINFTAAELADIDAFFSTPSGATFARKSFTMASDPRIMAATMEAMPALMGPIGELEAQAAAATADLPPARSFAELTAAERARISALTGFSETEIEEALAAQTAWTAIEPPSDTEPTDDHLHEH